MDAAAKVHVSRQAGAATPATSAAPSVDLIHLRRFTLGDQRLEMEILALFIAQAPITLAALKDAGTDRDWKIAAHTLKGSARAVGAWHVARLAERAEGLSRRHKRAACDAAVRELEEAVTETRDFIVSLNSLS
jgi:HPt (histidine-containing phosphotransfer) domain-containing protein